MLHDDILVGAHMSISDGVDKALYDGHAIGANIVQIFTANQRSWVTKDFSQEDIFLFLRAQKETKISHIMSHNSYLINLGSNKKVLLSGSRKAMQEELVRCEQLNLSYLNFHPGSATGSDEKTCLDTIVESLLMLRPKGNVILLIETTAGQGSCVGYKFEHLAYIIEKVDGKIPLGVTIDTCHIFAAGYDIRTRENWEATLKQFDDIIGLKHLKAFHVNDSIASLGERKDRHAPLGKGKIGLESFKFIMQDKRVKHLPKYLETPFGEENWAKEIKLLKTWARL